jgi:predicted metal-binding protein
MIDCDRACTVAFQAAGKQLNYFGGLIADAETAKYNLARAQLHAAALDGMLLRSDSHASLRNSILARIPPLGATPVTAQGE